METQKPDHISAIKTLSEIPTYLPSQFHWSPEDLVSATEYQLSGAVIDLKGFLEGDFEATEIVLKQIIEACSGHGFFHVINHGVDEELIREAHEQMDVLFKLPMSQKLGMKRKPGDLCGYSGAHADRFSQHLPWKEMLSFHHKHGSAPGDDVVQYITSILGNDFHQTGVVFQRYCEALKELAMGIFRLLGMSLGVEGRYFEEIFEGGGSLMRINNYPPCPHAELTLGTGPHTDPNALTIYSTRRSRRRIAGFTDGKWRRVRPLKDAFAVNIGDTFMALTNGRYKSCVHRAVVNQHKERRSMVFFVSPRDDRVLRPPPEIVTEGRMYADFTWSLLRGFTQKHYRVDSTTLQNFMRWLALSGENSPISRN